MKAMVAVNNLVSLGMVKENVACPYVDIVPLLDMVSPVSNSME